MNEPMAVVTAPVVDPRLPEDVRRALERDPSVLHPGSGPVPGLPLGGRRPRDFVFALWQAPLWTYLPALVGTLYSTRVRNAALAAQVLVVAAFAVAPEIALVAGLALQPVVYAFLVSRCGEGEAGRLARLHHGRYLRPQELGGERRRLLERARKAVAAVLGSRSQAEGLLDDIRNAVTLPHQVWEIAETLFELDRLAAEHRGADPNDPRVAELLAPQREVLRLATASVSERISALESYAAQVRAADAALEQWEVVQRLAAKGDAYRDLLARTVRDELAVAEIDGLTEQARAVEEALRASIEKARRAGLALVPAPAPERKVG
ncbi:hypothetical protein LO762_02175 [Actinocorallia sp. API 0066]|uniref:hypothetical protein n=1 Tax=Actinocorallia sp. API 0066 TaxID=2896846 RepID=UPI001E3B14BB|nr:hypothetical protein [Actinocorallia sp. API 0066]MCD0448008.1 hypothetical protein [Actinocorallia sp. API 0066]